MSFARSLFTVSGLTVVSRVGGFIRDSLTAIFLGAGPVADAFFVAQRLPNLFRSLFAEGAFSSAFVPLYTTERERHGDAEAQAFAGQALMLLLAALIPFSALMMFFMPQVALILAPGFQNDAAKYKMTVDFCTITFPYLALISVTALQTGVLNAQGRFGPGAAAPIAFNIVLILGLFIAHFMHLDIGYTLAWAVTLSGVVQCAWLAISCRRAGASIPLVRPHFGEASKRLFYRIGPGAVGAGVYQINLMISTNLASSLPSGSISHLNYADRLNQLPLGIIGIAVATTLLPLLSRHIANNDEAKANHYLNRGIEFCLLLGLPAMIGLALLARPIVHILFEHGAFNEEDMHATVAALRAYAIGIPGFLLVKVFAAAFFARHDTKTPVKVAIIALMVNVVCALVLRGPLQHIGIALSVGIAASVNATLLYIHLHRRGHFGADATTRQRAIKIIGAAALMALVCGALMHFGWNNIPFTGYGLETVYLIFMMLVSAAVYGVSLQKLGIVNLADIKTMLRRPTKP